MIKMDKFWVATASMLHPSTDSKTLLTLTQIQKKYVELFSEPLPSSLEQQLISWKRRYADKNNESRGGSRKRYLYRTDDGHTPNARGKFRLYKTSDLVFDGEEKSGPSHPAKNDVYERFQFLIDWYLDDYVGSSVELDVEAESRYAKEIFIEKGILESGLSVTEKERLVKARLGQGIFKKNVAKVEIGCRLSSVTDLTFLVASHIKPWSVSTNEERLDGHNGLLLAPHVDRLFDYGFITFKLDGTVIVSEDAEMVCQQWNLNLTICRTLTQQQEDYMQYHREHIFRDRD